MDFLAMMVPWCAGVPPVALMIFVIMLASQTPAWTDDIDDRAERAARRAERKRRRLRRKQRRAGQ